MGELFIAYLQNSLQLSVVALLMLIFSPLFVSRYSAKCRYYLWIVIFVALVLPIRLKISITLPEAFQPILLQATDTATPGAAMAVNAVKTWEWHQYAGLLWAVGTFVFLAWHLFQYLHFLSAVKRWSEDIKSSDVLEQFALAKAKLGIRNHITIKSCACIKTPMVIGLLHPVGLLPQIDFSQDELPLILKHELVHYKRKDLWYKALMMLALAIHWFNPVVHLMVRAVLTLCEISCDEEVLRGIDTKGRVRYGEAIISVVRNGSAYQTVLSTNFYSGIKGMKKRIYAMMDMTSKRFSPALFMAVLIITVCGTTTFALSFAQAQGIVQDSDKAKTAIVNATPENVEALPVRSSSAPDTEQDNQEKPDLNNNELVPGESEPVLMPISEYPAEPNQLQSYDPDMPRLIADDEQ